MTLQNLYYFSEIVKDLNLGVTAERLYTSQQALSGHVKRLESHFGVRLFERRPNLVLTEEGKLLAEEAHVILDSESRLFIAYGTGIQKKHGALRIACGLGRSKAYLPAVLSEFSVKYPEVQVSCVDENIYKNSSMFHNEQVDVAVGRVMDNNPYIFRKTLFQTEGAVLVSKHLLKDVLGAEYDPFVKFGLRYGVDLNDLPRSIPIQHAGMPGQEHWLCDVIPVIREFPKVVVSHGNSDMLFEMCRSGRAMVLISDIYSKFIQETFSENLQKDVLFFRHMNDGKPVMMNETLSYNAKIPHPQFFFDFISILEKQLRSRGLMQP